MGTIEPIFQFEDLERRREERVKVFELCARYVLAISKMFIAVI